MFNRYLLINILNIFKIELIDIKYKLMIKNNIVLNIYNLMKIMNL